VSFINLKPIVTPTITVPNNFYHGEALLTITVDPSYVEIASDQTHVSTDWYFYSDAAGTNLVESSIGDTTNLNYYPYSDWATPGTTYSEE